MLQILLFVHILAVVMLFSGIALELVAFTCLHRAATVGEVRAATQNFPFVGPLMGMGSLLLVGAGIALVYAGGFGWSQPWIDVTFFLTLILAVNGPVTNGKRSQAIHRLAAEAPEGPLTADIRRARSDGFLNYSINLSLFELIAALFIMTTKPGISACIGAVLLGAVAAAGTATLLSRRSAKSIPESAIPENA